ncbi:protein kinase family protein [Luteococcus sp. OSA5]|uniref:protein kinase family protein n=1 Tax=Luteococcus sp. OSA5 TaxID=3401630 RepID=UPI003B436F8E
MREPADHGGDDLESTQLQGRMPPAGPEPLEDPGQQPASAPAGDGDEPSLTPAMATSDPAPQAAHQPPRVAAGDVYAGRYRLEQQLAQRGGTLTWRAFDQKLSRSVLVHLLSQDDPRSAEVLDSARKAAFATDSRFLRVLDAVVGEQPEEPSLVVCEFAPGESLERLLRQGPLSALEAAWVARELADAMQTMHSEGLFHQRINPDTVIITATGNVKIVGFLIEAAMYPDQHEQALAWSEREQADVTAIGKVLYASLVTRWPTPRDQLLDGNGEPRRTWGMLPAPMDAHGWLTPRQVRSGVSPALDEICDQVLSEAPHRNAMPLRTASQVAKALSKVLGTADAAADLERRMRYPVVPQDEGGGRAALLETTASMRAVDPDETTVQSTVPSPGAATFDVGGDAAAAGIGAGQAAAAMPSSPATPSAPGEADPAPSGRPAGARSATRAPRSSRPPRRRWLSVLVALVALALLVGLLRVLLGKTTMGGGGDDDEQAGKPLQISAVADFDPTGDGGNAEENPAQVKNAWDGDPATAWKTLTYLNDPKLGKLKPGVGLVVDLGERRQVGRVKLTMQGAPTAVELRVPTDNTTDKAPATSSKQWTTVASEAKAGTNAELVPEQAVESRYVLVYLTSLPKVSGNKYQASIAEIEVLS